MTDTQIIIERNYRMNALEIWIFRQSQGERIYYNISDKGDIIETVLRDVEFETKLKPFLELPLRFSQFFFDAISNYNSKNGIKTENENLLKGKLEATEKHLEDLRKHFDLLINKIVK